MIHRRELYQHGLELKKLFARIDTDENGMLTHDEFMVAMEDEEVRTMMEDSQLNPADAHMFYKVLQSFSHEDGVDIVQFIDGCMQMRGAAAGIDVQILRCQTNNIASQIQIHQNDLAQMKMLLKTCAAERQRHSHLAKDSPARPTSLAL